MRDCACRIGDLIRGARSGDAEALGELLVRYRDHLRSIADRQLGGRIARRVDASDVVQQTCLEAQRDFRDFLGSSEPELVAWFERILERNVTQVIRDHALIQKRAVNRERSRDDSRDSQGNQANQLAADQSSPSQRAMRGEAVEQLARAIDQLPAGQREAVRLRYLEGRSLAEIAKQLDRNTTAAAGLLKRGMTKLREILREVGND
jgi:RNA polymerase sigma-70 factor (ECF subfamily)